MDKTDLMLSAVIKDVYIDPKDILKVFLNTQGEKKLRKFLYWGYVITDKLRKELKNRRKQAIYDSEIEYKEVIQSYYKFVTIELVNQKKSFLAPAVFYYRVFYPSVEENNRVDIAIDSPHIDIPPGLNLVDTNSHFAGPCIITYIEQVKMAPKCALLETNGILPSNLAGTVYLRENYDNIYIYTKHPPKRRTKVGTRKLIVIKEGS